MQQFVGFFLLDSTLLAALVTHNTSGVPTDPTGNATFRVYGPTGVLMANGTGTLSRLDTGSVTGATNASPIVITSANHGLQTGTRVNVENVGGNTAANGYWTITRIDANTFSLDGSTGNGAYTSGGTWHVAGLHSLSLSLASGDGYDVGKTYTVVVTYNTGSVQTDTYTFTVN